MFGKFGKNGFAYHSAGQRLLRINVTAIAGTHGGRLIHEHPTLQGPTTPQGPTSEAKHRAAAEPEETVARSPSDSQSRQHMRFEAGGSTRSTSQELHVGVGHNSSMAIFGRSRICRLPF